MLERLRDYPFDVRHEPEGFVATVTMSEAGVPKRVLDHLKASGSSDDAAERYARHRVALRSERIVEATPRTDEVEGQLISALARLADKLHPVQNPDSESPVVLVP